MITPKPRSYYQFYDVLRFLGEKLGKETENFEDFLVSKVYYDEPKNGEVATVWISELLQQPDILKNDEIRSFLEAL